MKKKIIVLIMALACLLSALALTACFGGGDDEPDDGRPSYTVTFVVPAGAEFSGSETVSVKEGDKIPEPPKPTFDGKTFSGWYSGKSSSSRWNFEEGTVTADITLTAWFSGGVTCPHTTTVPVPEKSTPANCEKDGKEYVRCTSCGLTTFTIIKKFGHDFEVTVVPETCATEGYTQEVCKNEGCDKVKIHSKVPATGNHSYGTSFETIISPTTYVGGKEAKVCTVCGYAQTFNIPSIAEMGGLLYLLDIGNYKYTGGSYVDAAFVDIAKFAGASASSYYTVCTADKASDGNASTFWCADTLADGSDYTNDSFYLTFNTAYDIGMVKVTLPHYSAWGLGEDCYVEYDLQALNANGEWESVGVISDKNASPTGSNGTVVYEFEAPVNTSSLRFKVTNSSRYAPAMIYEIEVMAAVEDTERVSADLLSAATLASSGKYNSWAKGADAILDGSHSTGWQTNMRDKTQGLIPEVYASLTFAESKFVTAVQFSVAPNANKTLSIHYMDENDEWVKLSESKITRGNTVSFTDGGELVTIDGAERVIFTINVERFTKGVKLVIDQDGDPWSSFVYEFTPFTAVEQAHNFPLFLGCEHGAFKELETVAPTCSTAGYKNIECYGCGFKARTDATDAYGHNWSDYAVATAATTTTAGTKTSTCSTCQAVRTTNYYETVEDATITKYFHNAPAAWAQTLDDGNYLATYEWIIPKLQKYGWKASAMLSVCFSDVYVEQWQGYLATGALDIGSHSYTHGGYYSGPISEDTLLSDVHAAHYWFMSKYAGQRILSFATPNGATSIGTSEYITSLMCSARNGGASKYFYNVIEELRSNGQGQTPAVDSITVNPETGEVIFTQALDGDGNPLWLSERRAWGNMNSYISKSDQSEGPFVFVSKDGKIASQKYKKVTQVAVIDEETGEQAVDENGNPLWENLATPIYEETTGGYDKDQGGNYTFNEKGGTHSLIKIAVHYVYVANADLGVNYVYDEETNRLQDKGMGEGSYRYVEVKDGDKILDQYYEWVEVGSYDLVDGEFVFRDDNEGQYKLNHPELGSYEKGINQILEVGGMTVECLHEIGNGGTIWASYASTNSKFQYLAQTGIWVCSYTELVQYLKEQLNATVTTVSRTDTQIELSLTDTLEDYMFNLPLTIKVDITDTWTEENIVATQNGEAISFFVEDGYAYVDAVPDRGAIVISYNG